MSDAAGAPKPCSRILPPFWFLLAAAAAVGLHRVLPVADLIPSPWNRLGLILIAVGLGLDVVAASMFWSAHTPLRPTERPTALVTGGVYRLTRNPMYLGMVLILAGLALALGSATPWTAPLVFALWIERCFIRAEERAMEALFGESYREYRSGVRRWIGTRPAGPAVAP